MPTLPSACQPTYFEGVRSDAASRWDRIKGDPENENVYRTLFQQVRNIWHVASELLQNADDADAQTVKISLDNSRLVFKHDGRDFSEDEFRSLCRFAFSNKRHLSTIGFRGIGFKSTFALGPDVELRTETLAVRFNEDRFFEPRWIEGADFLTAGTEISVRIADQDSERLLKTSLESWLSNPASLLFFRHIECLEILDKTLIRSQSIAGPTDRSYYFDLLGGEDEAKVLVIESEREDFPESALLEVRQNRGEMSLELPAVAVQVVLGLKEQEIYSVLPSGVRWSLPFSCNGPFMLTPGRDCLLPNSPTNQWLLARAGRLVADTIKAWLADSSPGLAARAEAYQLLHDGTPAEGGVPADSQTTVEKAVSASLEGEPLLLTQGGLLVARDECLAVPAELLATWAEATLCEFFVEDAQELFADVVPKELRRKLVRTGLLNELAPGQAIDRLRQARDVPKPESWDRLAALWAFIFNCQRKNGLDCADLPIVPTDGSDFLKQSEQVLRVDSKPSKLEYDDWVFLLTVTEKIDGEWIAFLDKSTATDTCDAETIAAANLLNEVGLDKSTSLDHLLRTACERYTDTGSCDLQEVIRLGRLIAALDTRTPESLPFVTRSGSLSREPTQLIVILEEARERLYPEEWKASHALHTDYTSVSQSSGWDAWIRSGKCPVPLAPPPGRAKERRLSKDRTRALAAERGLPNCRFSFPYQGAVEVTDCDYPSELLNHWEKYETEQQPVWADLILLLLRSPTLLLRHYSYVYLSQSGYTHTKSVGGAFIPAAWIVRFRTKACLPDDKGFLRQPAELLLSNGATEPYRGVERFLAAELDTPVNREFLELLGVRSTPSGIDKLLERVRALATVTEPERVFAEIDRWYDALARVHQRASQAEWCAIVEAFASEPLILVDGPAWATSRETYRTETGIAGAGDRTVHVAVRSNDLWRLLEIADAPKATDLLCWLEGVPTDAPLSNSERQRVRHTLARFPQQIWEEQSRWLGLDGELHRVEDFRYRLAKGSLSKWTAMFHANKSKTADMLSIGEEITSAPPFDRLIDLVSVIRFRARASPSGQSRDAPAWLRAFGLAMSRLIHDPPEEEMRLRELGGRLTRTAWEATHSLSVEPLVEGTPFGESFPADAVWDDHTLFVSIGSTAAVMDAVVGELARPFRLPKIQSALQACFDRDPRFVSEYLGAHFEFDASVPSPVEPEILHGAGPQAPPDPLSVGNEPFDVTEEPASPEVDYAATDPAPRITVLSDAPGPTTQQRERPREPVPQLITKFASMRGFVWNAKRQLFERGDGDLIVRNDPPFPWELRHQSNGRHRRFWLAEQTLGGGGLVLPSNVWEQVRRSPEEYALVILGQGGSPIELAGEEIVARHQRGDLELYPVNYRIREKPTA